MGTSTTGSELHSDKLVKLQARKKELEALLAAKNEDLYKLCVREVKLTGVVPPETPAEAPQSPAEARRDQGAEGRRGRQGHRQTAGKDAPSTSRKQISHRLSTPSISGLSIKSTPARRTYLEGSSSSGLAHDGRDAVSLHASQTYPSLQPSLTSYSRHHTLTSERAVKLQYSSGQPAAQTFSRETHFSSSHPDISSRYVHTQLGTQAPGGSGMPLLYQMASQLRTCSPHLSAVQMRPGRGSLQRTQTYHLTAHSDHPPPPPPPHHSSPLSPLTPLSPVSSMSPLSPLCLHSGSNPSIYSSQSGDQDTKVKEKEWYESSLDSPTDSSGMNLSKESVQYHSPKKVVPLPASTPPPPLPPPAPTPALAPAVPFESPKNCTVVESGKWIPYREVSKPFEMSDFYKYSTKFRQGPRPAPEEVPFPPPPAFASPEQWRL